MERYTLQKLIEIIKIQYKNGENLADTVRNTRTFLGRHEAPCRTAIKKLVEKFELLGQVSDVKNQADWVVEMHENDPEFHQKIILSNEAHFHLDGFVNKRNCRIWGSNSIVIVEKPLYPQCVTVWCALWTGRVIGPYFFENEAEATVTLNVLRYQEMINDFLWPKLDSIDLDNVYFQQDCPRATQATKPLIFCGKSFRTVLSLQKVITIGHLAFPLYVISYEFEDHQIWLLFYHK